MSTIALTEQTPYFEYCYSSSSRKSGEKTLIVSFPGRKTNRHIDTPSSESPAFLSRVLNNSDADVLFVRSAYKGDPNLANITEDYDLLPGLLHDLRKQNNIDRIVLFGFSLGCAPCLWLARKYVADDVVLLSPGLFSVVTLAAVEDNRWEQDFKQFYTKRKPPEIEQYSQDVQMKIIQGGDLEGHLHKERDLVEYIKTLNPSVTVKRIPGVGHHIPKFWKSQGDNAQGQEILEENIHAILGVEQAKLSRPQKKPNWLKLESTFLPVLSPKRALPLVAYG